MNGLGEINGEKMQGGNDREVNKVINNI